MEILISENISPPDQDKRVVTNYHGNVSLNVTISNTLKNAFKPQQFLNFSGI